MREGLGEDAAFFNMPPGDSGDAVNIGATSFPMHLGQDREPGPRGRVSRLDRRVRRRQRAGRTQQIPAATDATVEMGDPLGQGIKDGWDGNSSRAAG